MFTDSSKDVDHLSVYEGNAASNQILRRLKKLVVNKMGSCLLSLRPHLYLQTIKGGVKSKSGNLKWESKEREIQTGKSEICNEAEAVANYILPHTPQIAIKKNCHRQNVTSYQLTISTQSCKMSRI